MIGNDPAHDERGYGGLEASDSGFPPISTDTRSPISQSLGDDLHN
jgi:hypothetical protein